MLSDFHKHLLTPYYITDALIDNPFYAINYIDKYTVQNSKNILLSTT